MSYSQKAQHVFLVRTFFKTLNYTQLETRGT